MTDHFDDDFDFWGDQRSEPTIQIDRVRRRAPERTRSHHIVRREPSPDSGPQRGAELASVDELDDHDTLWVETNGSAWNPRRAGARGSGVFSVIDPRVLSVGAIAIAAVLAVPLFGALSDKDTGEDSFLSVAEAETTTTTMAPTSVVVITAALNPVGEADDANAHDASDAAATASAGNSDSAGSGDASAASGFSGGSGDGGGTGEAAGVLAAPAVRAAAQCGNPYEVEAGDFWVALADAVGVSLDELLEYNEATQATPIYPGSIVCLPLGTSVAPPTDAPTEPPTSTVAPSTAPVTTGPAADPATTPTPTVAPATGAPATTTATTGAPEADDSEDEDDGTIPLPTNPPPSGGEVEQMIRDIWPDDLEDQALRIAWRESNYRPNVTSSTGCCLGVFQLHWEAHGGWMAGLGITSREQLFDARTNIQAAYVLYQRSGGWGPWQ